ncbi:MAG: alpha/beta hydrolase family protein, partial [Terriglobales bacterium]
MTRNLQRLVLVTFVTIASAAAQAPARATPKLSGWWEGALGGTALRLQLHITRSGAGWQGMFTSLDQGNAKFPATSITRHGAQVTMAASEARATFTATLHANQLAGTWHQNGGSLPLVLRRQPGPVSSPRPQRPKPPFPYQSTDVKLTSTGGVQLAGTLTVPNGKGPFAAAILIPGSGATNRNETLFGHNIFWVLADALSRHGLAVLRMDKRGIGQSGGDANAATLADYAHDVAADLAFLEKRGDIDAHRIGLIGHSEG